jgi:diguanylate cyclase (GGDEF)-like protein
MHEHNHRDIIVTNRSIFYVLTTADLIALKVEATDFSRPLSSLELCQVPTLPEKENVINAVDLINQEHEYLCLIDDDNNLSGIVTNSDIVASVDPQIMLENLTLESLFEKRYSFMIVETDATMKEAIEQLQASSHDCIIVAENGYPVGIITSKDILRCLKNNTGGSRVREYMSSPLQTLTEEIPIKEALNFINEKRFKRIVVVDKNGKISGIVSQQELIAQTYMRWSNLIKEHYHEVEELSQILEQKNRQLLTLATKDRLTGVNNRHMFEEQFKKEYAFAMRYGVALHLFILDIDHFKTINDTYGHLVGDAVLKEFAHLVETSARSSDFFARWGGEEFVLLVHNSSDDDAKQIAEKVRERIAEHPFEFVGAVTCSIGLCRVDPEIPLSDNIARADTALYRAKHEGRDRVRAYCGCDGATL